MIVITKFVFSLVFIGYLVVSLTRLMASIPNFDRLNRDLVENSDTINLYFKNIEETNFIIIISKWMFGDWGASFQENDLVSLVLEPYYQATVNVIIFSLIISAFVSLLIVHALNWKFGHTRHLRIFKGNWPSFVLVILFFIITLRLSPTIFGELIYDGSTDNDFTETPAYSFNILLLSLLGIFKFLAEMNTITLYQKESLGDSIYPTKDTEIDIQPSETMISPTKKWLLVLKPTLTILPQYLIFIEQFFNTPGLSNRVLQAIIFTDLPIVVAITFQFIITISVMRLLIDLILIFADSYEFQFDRKMISVKNKSSSLIMNLFGLLTYFIMLLIILMGGFYLFTGFNFGTDGILKNPNYVDINNKNLSPFSDGYLLGTDFLGRDVFTQIIISPTIYFLPILVAILVRPVIVLLVDLIPDRMDISISHEIFDMMDSIPKIPTLLFLSIFISMFVDQLFINIILAFTFSMLFWGWIGKKYVMTDISINGTLWEKLSFLIHLSILSAMIEYIIIDLLIGFTQFGLGSVFNATIQNSPSQFFGVFMSVVFGLVGFILIPYIFIHGKLSKS